MMSENTTLSQVTQKDKKIQNIVSYADPSTQCLCVDLSGYVCTGGHASRGSTEKWGSAVGHYDMKSKRRVKGVG